MKEESNAIEKMKETSNKESLMLNNMIEDISKVTVIDARFTKQSLFKDICLWLYRYNKFLFCILSNSVS